MSRLALNLHREASFRRSVTDNFGKPFTDVVFEHNAAVSMLGMTGLSTTSTSVGSSTRGGTDVEEYEMTELHSRGVGKGKAVGLISL